MINDVRDEEQRKTLKAWQAVNFIGTAELCTGFGKTRVGVMAADGLEKYDIKHGLDFRALIIAPTEVIKDNWTTEFIKWGHKSLLQKVTIECIQTVYKWEDTEWSLVIADEIHNYLSSEFGKFFENNTYKRLLGLSAHIPLELRPILNNIAPVFYSMGLKEAKDKKIVSDYIIYGIEVPLTFEEQAKYDTHDTVVRRDYSKYSGRSFADLPKYMKDAISARKTIVYESENKILAAREISDIFPNRDGIIFAMTKQYCEIVANAIGDNSVVYHSGMTKKDRVEAIRLLNDKRTRVNRIISIKALREGFNVPSISLVLIVSGEGKIKSFIQQAGRGGRYLEDKLNIIILLSAKGTKDKDWIAAKAKGETIKWLKNIDELKQLYGKETKQEERSNPEI